MSSFKFIEPLEKRTLLTVVALGNVPSGEYPIVNSTPGSNYPNNGNSDVAELNGAVYYLALESNGYMGLWKGGAAPSLVEDLHDTNAFGLVAIGQKLLMLSQSASTNVEVWTSSGTTSTTREANSFSGQVDTKNLTLSSTAVIGSNVFYSLPTVDAGTNEDDRLYLAISPTFGSTVWEKSVTLPTAVATPFVQMGQDVYFLSDDGLWKSTGGNGQPQNVYSINFINAGGTKRMMATIPGEVVFSAGNTTYIYNGSTVSTVSTLSVSAVASDGTNIYLGAEMDSQTGVELYRLNGTTPQLIADVWPDAGQSSSPQNFVFANGLIYFTANSADGREVWQSDGTTATMVQDMWPGATSSSPVLIAYQNHAYFSAVDPTSGRELREINSDGTVTVLDDVPGAAGLDPQFRTSGTFLSFWGNSPASGYGLFTFNGASITQIGDYNPAAFSPTIPMAVAGNTLYFASGDTTADGNELYGYSASTGISLIDDIIPGPLSSLPQGLTGINGTLYFAASFTGEGIEPWTSNSSGTAMLRDAVPGSSSSQPKYFTQLGTKVIFTGYTSSSSSTRYIWITDGTSGGTSATSLTSQLLIPYNTGMVIAPNNTAEAISIIGTTGSGQASRLISTGTGIGSSTLIGTQFVSAPNGYYFYDSSGQPYSVLGQLTTISGTGNVNYGFAEGNGNVMYLTSQTNQTQYSTGTLRVTTLSNHATVVLGTYGPMSAIFSDGNTFYFGDFNNGYHLYRSGGTVASTYSIGDFQDMPRNFIDVNGRVYFVANGGDGNELYTTDGTAEGTFEVADINPGPASSSPNNLTNFNGTLMFTANDGESLKLFEIVPPEVPVKVLSGSYALNTNSVTAHFTTDVSASLSAADLQIDNITTGQMVTPISVAFDETTHTATWQLPDDRNVLTDGNYTVDLPAGSVTDASGDPMAADFQSSFFILTGDANHDRTVNALDFNALATNYGKPGTFSQGDFDYSGTVDSNDFALLASRYGSGLSPIAGSALPAPILASSLSRTSVDLFADNRITPTDLTEDLLD